MKVKHIKGFHFPFNLPKWKKCNNVIAGNITFDENSVYDVGTDQEDWNKVIAFKQEILSQQKDGAMIVWRYNKNLELFELTLYVHGGSDSELSNNLIYEKDTINIYTKGYPVGKDNAYVNHYVFKANKGEKKVTFILYYIIYYILILYYIYILYIYYINA